MKADTALTIVKVLLGGVAVVGLFTAAPTVVAGAVAARATLGPVKEILDGWTSARKALAAPQLSALDALEKHLTASVAAVLKDAPHEFPGADLAEQIASLIVQTLPTRADLVGDSFTATAAQTLMMSRLPADTDPPARALFGAILAATLPPLFDDPAFRNDLAPQIDRAMFAALSGIRSDTTEILRLVQGLYRPEGLSQDALLILARRVNAEVDDPATARRELERAVDIAANVLREGLRGSNLDAIVNEVLKRLAALTGAGRFAEAQAEAERALAEAEDGLESAQARRDRLLASALETTILNRDAEATARHLLRRLDLDSADPQDRFDALRALWQELYVRGRDKGLAFDLAVSIALARASYDRAHDADQRGAALNDLGTALWTLGARESGTARLEEAVAAYREALIERTRDRVPLDWAMTQNNLGGALRALGTRESGTARLTEAVAANRAALTEWTRDRVPLGWATAQMNLGNALATLGARESGTARLEEAVAAYRKALTERTRDRVPLDWARTQMNLGNALQTLGERESGTARLTEAVAAYRAALTERTRECVPLDWAMTQMNLGAALLTLGTRESGTARLTEAVAAYRAALTEWTRERVPLDWAGTTGNLGSAQRALAARTGDLALAREALANLRVAEKVSRDGGHIVNADILIRLIPEAEALIARLS